MREKQNFTNLFGENEPTVELHRGEVLFAKGDKAVKMYVVRSGAIEISDGPVVLEIVGPGEIFGEMAMVDGAPRSATAKAVEESLIIPVDERRFLTMVERTPTFAVKVMRILGTRLRDINERLLRALEARGGSMPPP